MSSLIDSFLRSMYMRKGSDLHVVAGDPPRMRVTGKTGSGKSTTLAAVIDAINGRKKGHILTIEDPIEFVHQRKQCLISQREVGVHSPSFADALHSALREDPDAILVGELRDL